MGDATTESLDATITSALGGVELSEAPRVPLWHYTDRDGFLGILASKKIWATDFRFLNDAQEVLIGENEIYGVVEEFRAPGGQRPMVRGLWDRFAAFRPWAAPTERLLSVTVASFSEEADDLSQWRAYGSGQRGCGLSIGITFPDLAAWAASEGAFVVRCDYDQKNFQKEVRNTFSRVSELHARLLDERQFSPEDIRTSLLSRAHQEAAVLSVRRKHQGFGGEKEWRIVTIEADLSRIERRQPRLGGVPVPFVKVGLPLVGELISLAGVRVGPSPDLNERLTDVRLSLVGAGYDLDALAASSRVAGSEIPFRPPRA